MKENEIIMADGSIEPKKLRVRLTFFRPILGSGNANPHLHEEFIASKSQSKEKTEEEVEAINVDETISKEMTVFARTEDGRPCLWDYQIKGFFKHACKMMAKVPNSESSKLKAYLKMIDGEVFISERKIPFENVKEITSLQRPLRASTLQGERIALANSEMIPEGASVEFTIEYLVPSLEKCIKEWLRYGHYVGLGQWRNSRAGSFNWEEVTA